MPAPSEKTEKPSLPALEHLVVQRRNAEALEIAVQILEAINVAYGRLDGVLAGATYPRCSEEDAAVIFATRFAAAFGRLMTEPGLETSVTLWERLLGVHRWIDLIFSLSGFRNSDHFISNIGRDAGDGRISFEGPQSVAAVGYAHSDLRLQHRS